MTLFQKTAVTACALLLTGVAIYETCEMSQLRGQLVALQRERQAIEVQAGQIKQERDGLLAEVASLRADLWRQDLNTVETVRLRGEVGLLRRMLAESRQSVAATAIRRESSQQSEAATTVPEPDPAVSQVGDSVPLFGDVPLLGRLFRVDPATNYQSTP